MFFLKFYFLFSLFHSLSLSLSFTYSLYLPYFSFYYSFIFEIFTVKFFYHRQLLLSFLPFLLNIIPFSFCCTFLYSSTMYFLSVFFSFVLSFSCSFVITLIPNLSSYISAFQTVTSILSTSHNLISWRTWSVRSRFLRVEEL